ncbi:MAG: UvrD-helicase domain-containing protein [Akkermansiaceae bacterium]|nr:UvrD-helicase domain-containing protein [Akkermansiaceae bacterium]
MNILAKNLLILASAGSGKTFQLGNRVIGLVASGAAPERIVALTFTRKAAGEFADSVLTKLAEAAGDQGKAASLRGDLGLPEADFGEALEKVVRALPSFTLGTMDSFFAKIVRGFQYELGLTGGKFDLLEGPRATAMADELLASILGDTLARDQDEQFYHAFRRATIGREDHGVLEPLRQFVRRWQAIYQEAGNLAWGPQELAGTNPDEWEKHKSALAARIRPHFDGVEYTRKGQREALEKEIDTLENHVIGSGSLGSRISSLLANILEAVATQSGPLRVKSYTEFTIRDPAAAGIREMVELAARCELAAALQRTRAVRDVVSVFDALCADRLRRRGLLGFNDVKLLMGEWARNEDARLRRESVDFRLDSRIDHWLLDEFQDTSRSDWTGLQPLIDEAASGEDGSMFIVGDRKQAIYAWRGGDVSLFDEIMTRYDSGLSIESMAESWRSCPEVLELVNRVCGDTTTLHELFGEVADRWVWENHFPAAPLAKPSKSGTARVEMVGDWEERLDRMVEILNEIGVGKRAMTCGILVRGNKQVREVTDFLRSHDFDVIEEGRREPAKDNPVGIAISHLLNWLADPADPFSWEVVEMSKLAPALKTNDGESRSAIWEGLTERISQVGFAESIGSLIGVCSEGWSDFGKRRAGDLVAALADFDAQGGISPREAADWVARLEVSQSPGEAAVQVMTIHKSKGLGFDVVLLPEIPPDGIPQAQYFDIAEGPGWLSQTPPKWARALSPEMREAEDRWAANQRYEAFCMLYVALTRAKRGLYVLLDPPSKSADPDKPALSNWLSRSSGAEGGEGVVFQSGSDAWSETIAPLEVSPAPTAHGVLPAAVPLRERWVPSSAKSKEFAPAHSASGMQFGSEVHGILESVGWIDESPPAIPRGDAGAAVAGLLQNSSLRPIFAKDGRAVDLLREQPTDAIIDGKFLTGIIDRLHLHRDASGKVHHVEIIDFKTDGVRDPAELVPRYAGQMEAYRAALKLIYPEAVIDCLLLSVRHGLAVKI